MDIGEPIALRARLAELRLEDASEAHSVERVALEVSHRINRATPVTPTAAVCVALLAADRALALEEVLQTLEPLADYLGSRDWPIAGGADITDVATVRRALQDLVTSGVLTSFSGGTATVWGIGPEQHLIAGVYRNSAIHVLVLRAIAEVAFVSASDLGSGTYDAWAECLRLRDLLKFEFFFPDRKQFAAELQSELRLIAPDLQTLDVSPSAEDAERHLGSMRLFVAHLVLRPFVDAYAIVAEQLLSLDDGSAFEEKRFVSQCLLLGQQWVLQRRISSAESVSAEMFQTALRLARHRGLVEATAPDVQQRRSDFVDEIRVLQRRVAQVAARAARLVS
jgi:glycerol-3-phosphate O-acyltransferase